MSRQSWAFLVLALTIGLSGCADEPAEPPPSTDSAPEGAAAKDAGGAADARVGAEANGPSSPRPAGAGSGRDAAASDASPGNSRDATVSGGSDAGPAGGRDTDAGAVKPRDGGAPSATPDAAAPSSSDLWRPKPGTTWQWDLSGSVTKLDGVAQVYDIDGFETDAATVAMLHAMGKKVICYLSVGTYEPARADAQDFPKETLGKYWPEWDETYVDIRSDALRAIIGKRLDMCKAKGFDAVEPDNMDMFEGGMSETGFPLTEADGVAYAKWLANETHARGMSIGQKNASSITGEIAALYDWALTEDCFADGWCDDMKAYPEQGKALFMCEYTDTNVDFVAACGAASQRKFSAILKKRELDEWVQYCQ